jgi:DNA-binding NarL/FixJ family response regulator
VRTVLVVEDHAETRQWWQENIRRVFADAGVDAAATLNAARKLCAENRYFLAIIDINLPDGTGLELIRELAADAPDTYLVVSTIFDDDHHVFAALRAGAQGYLLKDQPRDEQLARLRDILRGEPPLSPVVARRILRYFVDDRKKAEEDPGAPRLTTREREILALIAKGISRPEAARIMGLALNTISTYTKSIYQKLNISSRAEAVMEAMRLGIIDDDDNG